MTVSVKLSLPYELIGKIISFTSIRSSSFSLISSDWYYPNQDYLYTQPTITSLRALDVFIETLEQQPHLAAKVIRLTIMGLESASQYILVRLLQVLIRLQSLEVEAEAVYRALDWTHLFQYLSRSSHSITTIKWDGHEYFTPALHDVIPLMSDITSALLFPFLKCLVIERHNFNLIPLALPLPLASALPLVPLTGQPPIIRPNQSISFVSTLSLIQCIAPTTFFETLQFPYLTNLTFHSFNGVTAFEFERLLGRIGPQLTSLTILVPTNAHDDIIPLSLESFTLLRNLISLTLASHSVPDNMFNILPSLLEKLSLVVDENWNPDFIKKALFHELISSSHLIHLKLIEIHVLPRMEGGGGIEDEWAGAEAREYNGQLEWHHAKEGIISIGAQRVRPISVVFI